MNSKLVNLLGELAQIADLRGDIYREKAFRRAIIIIEKLPYEITAATLGKLRADRPEALGAGLMSRIEEYVRTGTIKEVNDPNIRAFRELSKIIGVGPVTAKRWIQRGIRDLAGLRKEVAKGHIELTSAQKYGLMYYADLNLRIPRDEVKALGDIVENILRKADSRAIVQIAGSYRRGAATSGDVDILVCSEVDDLLEKMICLLEADPMYIDSISTGSERVTFLYKVKYVRQIDVLRRPRANYYAALLYFTGDWAFNEAMRGWAKSRGYQLNQNGLYLRGKLIPVSSEQDIFTSIGLAYIEPAMRNAQAIKNHKVGNDK